MDCYLLRALSFQARLRSSRLNILTLMIMKHLGNIDPAINSALIVMVLAIGVTIQIIEALITAIDNIT